MKRKPCVLAQGFLLFVVQRRFAARRSFVGGFVAFQHFIFVLTLLLFRYNIKVLFQTLTSVCIVSSTQLLGDFREKVFCKTGFIFIRQLVEAFEVNLGFVAHSH